MEENYLENQGYEKEEWIHNKKKSALDRFYCSKEIQNYILRCWKAGAVRV
jgi:hypothetical protein